MIQSIVAAIVTVVVLGIGAKWLAWRIKVPSILLLLTVGFVAGPVTGVLPSSALQGDWVFAFVSLSIGIILFEGGLNLRRSELFEVGPAVLRLVTVGVLVTWVLAGVAAYYIVGLSLGMSIQLGAILTVTGPTVIIPLLRHVRPKGRVETIAKWEGITIDPVGAILSVLVLETILVLNSVSPDGTQVGFGGVLLPAIEGLLTTIIIAVVIGVAGATILVFLLYKRLVPDYLQSSVALMVVLGTYALSNSIRPESGLLEATILGILIANQKWVPLKRISEFKENLQVLLIACLFIVLSARLDISTLDYIDTKTIVFLVVLILLVRPVAVFLSCFKTGLDLKEKVFMSWLAPRGIVAAAVASLFAFELEHVYPEEVDMLVPLVFLVIVGTVAVYGLTLAPLARRLGLADPDPQGLVFLGAHAWARQLARTFDGTPFRVLLIDTNADNVAAARRIGLDAVSADALSESVIDELDLGGVGRFLALTPNDEINSLAALHFAEVFESKSVYQIDARPSTSEPGDDQPSSLRGRTLFGDKVNHSTIHDKFRTGFVFEAYELTEETTFRDLHTQFGGEALLLFVLRGTSLLINSATEQIRPEIGDTVVLLVPPVQRQDEVTRELMMNSLIKHALVLDVDDSPALPVLAKQAANWFSGRVSQQSDWLAKRFLDVARSGGMPVAGGAAFPHFRLPGIEMPLLVIVRCSAGIEVDKGDLVLEGGDQTEFVHAIFFLLSPEDHPGRHLAVLANLANAIDNAEFIPNWISATTEDELKQLLIQN